MNLFSSWEWLLVPRSVLKTEEDSRAVLFVPKRNGFYSHKVCSKFECSLVTKSSSQAAVTFRVKTFIRSFITLQQVQNYVRGVKDGPSLAQHTQTGRFCRHTFLVLLENQNKNTGVRNTSHYGRIAINLYVDLSDIWLNE